MKYLTKILKKLFNQNLHLKLIFKINNYKISFERNNNKRIMNKLNNKIINLIHNKEKIKLKTKSAQILLMI
jgi:hypothetical protein